MPNESVYVIATTLDAMRQTLEFGQRLAAAEHADLAVIVPLPERVTVSSARAHVRDVPVEDADHPDPELTVPAVRALAGRFALNPEIRATTGLDAPKMASILPPGATIVVCGRAHRFLETPEQRVARYLSQRQFDVVFLPKTSRVDGERGLFCETELMRRLVS
jgi:hypothetical protein